MPPTVMAHRFTRPCYRPGRALHEKFWRHQSCPDDFPAPVKGRNVRSVMAVVLGESGKDVSQFVNMIRYGSTMPDHDSGMLEYPVEYLCEGQRYGLTVSSMPPPAGRGIAMLGMHEEHVIIVLIHTASCEETARATEVVEMLLKELCWSTICVVGIVEEHDDQGKARRDELRAWMGRAGGIYADCQITKWDDVAGVLTETVERLYGKSLLKDISATDVEQNNLKAKRVQEVARSLLQTSTHYEEMSK